MEKSKAVQHAKIYAHILKSLAIFGCDLAETSELSEGENGGT